MNDVAWSFTDHACRACLGSVLRSGERFICSVCRAECCGTASGICGCGLLAKNGSKKSGFVCVANPKPTPANPARILIRFDELACAAPAGAPSGG